MSTSWKEKKKKKKLFSSFWGGDGGARVERERNERVIKISYEIPSIHPTANYDGGFRRAGANDLYNYPASAHNSFVDDE